MIAHRNMRRVFARRDFEPLVTSLEPQRLSVYTPPQTLGRLNMPAKDFGEVFGLKYRCASGPSMQLAESRPVRCTKY